MRKLGLCIVRKLTINMSACTASIPHHSAAKLLHTCIHIHMDEYTARHYIPSLAYWSYIFL